MISAWTKTDDLDRTTRRQICLLVADWCAQNLGTSYRGRPILKVHKSRTPTYYGLYDPNGSQAEIIIHWDVCDNVYRLITTTIHEWRHSLQKVRKSYNRLYREWGYNDHPMEIEARQAEKLWNQCWRDIKHKI